MVTSSLPAGAIPGWRTARDVLHHLLA